jgi:hypothetical protein
MLEHVKARLTTCTRKEAAEAAALSAAACLGISAFRWHCSMLL